MKHRLLLLRHAKSSHKDKALADYDRPLATRGRKDCRRVGKWLANAGMKPDLVISSPARRASQTAKKVVKHVDISPSSIQWEEKVYDANLKALLKLLADVSEDIGSVMLVGHHEGMESIILRLINWSDIPADPKLIPTGAIAWLEFEGSWADLKKCKDQLKTIVRPRDLAEHPDYA